MKALLILAAAASGHVGLLVRASATIVRGEPIRLDAPSAVSPTAADRQSSRIVRANPKGGGTVEFRLVEFQ